MCVCVCVCVLWLIAHWERLQSHLRLIFQECIYCIIFFFWTFGPFGCIKDWRTGGWESVSEKNKYWPLIWLLCGKKPVMPMTFWTEGGKIWFLERSAVTFWNEMIKNKYIPEISWRKWDCSRSQCAISHNLSQLYVPECEELEVISLSIDVFLKLEVSQSLGLRTLALKFKRIQKTAL